MWTLPGAGAILTQIEVLLPDKEPPDLSGPAGRAVASAP
jgi:hypothetical protein